MMDILVKAGQYLLLPDGGISNNKNVAASAVIIYSLQKCIYFFPVIITY